MVDGCISKEDHCDFLKWSRLLSCQQLFAWSPFLAAQRLVFCSSAAAILHSVVLCLSCSDAARRFAARNRLRQDLFCRFAIPLHAFRLLRTENLTAAAASGIKKGILTGRFSHSLILVYLWHPFSSHLRSPEGSAGARPFYGIKWDWGGKGEKRGTERR